MIAPIIVLLVGVLLFLGIFKSPFPLSVTAQGDSDMCKVFKSVDVALDIDVPAVVYSPLVQIDDNGTTGVSPRSRHASYK